MRVFNMPVPKSKMDQFIEILNATGGRFVRNPTLNQNTSEYRCDFEPGDYKKQSEMWNTIITPIVEKRSDQWWRKFIRRVI